MKTVLTVLSALLICAAAAFAAAETKRRLLRLGASGGGIELTVTISAAGDAEALEQAVKCAVSLCDGGRIIIRDNGMTEQALRAAVLLAEKSPRIELVSGGSIGDTECRENRNTSE